MITRSPSTPSKRTELAPFRFVATVTPDSVTACALAAGMQTRPLAFAGTVTSNSRPVSVRRQLEATVPRTLSYDAFVLSSPVFGICGRNSMIA